MTSNGHPEELTVKSVLLGIIIGAVVCIWLYRIATKSAPDNA